MQSLLLFLSLSVALSSAQFFYHQPATTFAYRPQQHYQLAAVAPAFKPISAPAYKPITEPAAEQYAHRSVVENSLREAELPPELSKSARFYNNPRIAAALAKESWFTEHEMPVLDREAEKIPREMVYKIFKNAGWIKRR